MDGGAQQDSGREGEEDGMRFILAVLMLIAAIVFFAVAADCIKMLIEARKLAMPTWWKELECGQVVFFVLLGVWSMASGMSRFWPKAMVVSVPLGRVIAGFGLMTFGWIVLGNVLCMMHYAFGGN